METWILFLPLLSALLCGIFGRFLGDRVTLFLSCLALVVAAILSVFLFFAVSSPEGFAYQRALAPWIVAGDVKLWWTIRVDTLSASMFAIVNFVSAAVHVYSVGYMQHDPHKARFFCYLGLFTFFMLMLVSAADLGQMFFGWEGVGLASYLLIGFWYEKPQANAAAIKAFLVNRVGDVGFVLAIAATFFLFGSLEFSKIFASLPELSEKTFSVFGIEFHALTMICILFLIGAMGKSAQLGLHTWLPDAMEGPTPVSALIHAATMVTAGVFMICRLSPLFEESELARNLLTYVGALTAIFAATVAITQNDIKRVIAYSTCSQLGYMFFAAGLSAYSAAMFHLMTHAFFKALLFLSAGSIIHALQGQQDIRKMGGVYKWIPLTYMAMLVGSFALTGIPPFAGAFSKDVIIEAAWMVPGQTGTFAFLVGIVGAFLTAMYSWRILLLAFHGPPRATPQVMSSVHEAPATMLVPIFLLALGAGFSGWLGVDAFVGAGQETFWKGSLVLGLPSFAGVPVWVVAMPALVAVCGAVVSWWLWFRRPTWPASIAEVFSPFYQFLHRKWFFDELFAHTLVSPIRGLSSLLWKRADDGGIDRFGPNGVQFVVRFVARSLSYFQSGYIYHYAFFMMAGIVLFMTWKFYNLAAVG